MRQERQPLHPGSPRRAKDGGDLGSGQSTSRATSRCDERRGSLAASPARRTMLGWRRPRVSHRGGVRQAGFAGPSCWSSQCPWRRLGSSLCATTVASRWAPSARSPSMRAPAGAPLSRWMGRGGVAPAVSRSPRRGVSGARRGFWSARVLERPCSRRPSTACRRRCSVAKVSSSSTPHARSPVDRPRRSRRANDPAGATRGRACRAATRRAAPGWQGSQFGSYTRSRLASASILDRWSARVPIPRRRDD